MGKISEIFNFDDIGTKIKNFTKWCCWITIFLVWIASAIGFLVCISNEWISYLCWIPLLSAIFAPFIIWIGSWSMYAFGEYVENIQIIKNQTVKSNRQDTTIQDNPSQTNANSPIEKASIARMPSSSQWKCICGRINENYVSTCTCGLSKLAVREISKQQNSDTSAETPAKPKTATASMCHTLEERLEHALMYKSDTGMIQYLKTVSDPQVQAILEGPADAVRERIQSLLETLK